MTCLLYFNKCILLVKNVDCRKIHGRNNLKFTVGILSYIILRMSVPSILNKYYVLLRL